MQPQRQVSPSYLFETIGRLTIENDILKKENEALIAQVKTTDPVATPSQAP